MNSPLLFLLLLMGFPSAAIVSVLSSFEQETNKTNAMITKCNTFHFTLFFVKLLILKQQPAQLLF
jgi:hypothetical protein